MEMPVPATVKEIQVMICCNDLGQALVHPQQWMSSDTSYQIDEGPYRSVRTLHKMHDWRAFTTQGRRSLGKARKAWYIMSYLRHLPECKVQPPATFCTIELVTHR